MEQAFDEENGKGWQLPSTELFNPKMFKLSFEDHQHTMQEFKLTRFLEVLKAVLQATLPNRVFATDPLLPSLQFFQQNTQCYSCHARKPPFSSVGQPFSKILWRDINSHPSSGAHFYQVLQPVINLRKSEVMTTDVP